MINSVTTANVAFIHFGIEWPFMAYTGMFYASKLCPGMQGKGEKMEMDNQLHGLLFWHYVKFFLVRCAKEYDIPIPGLSTTDAEVGGISSCDKVDRVAVVKLEEMRVAIEKSSLVVPNLNSWFFQKPVYSSAGEEEEESGSSSGSGSERIVGCPRSMRDQKQSGEEDEDGSGAGLVDSAGEEDGQNEDEEEMRGKAGGGRIRKRSRR